MAMIVLHSSVSVSTLSCAHHIMESMGLTKGEVSFREMSSDELAEVGVEEVNFAIEATSQKDGKRFLGIGGANQKRVRERCAKLAIALDAIKKGEAEFKDWWPEEFVALAKQMVAGGPVEQAAAPSEAAGQSCQPPRWPQKEPAKDQLSQGAPWRVQPLAEESTAAPFEERSRRSPAKRAGSAASRNRGSPPPAKRQRREKATSAVKRQPAEAMEDETAAPAGSADQADPIALRLQGVLQEIHRVQACKVQVWRCAAEPGGRPAVAPQPELDAIDRFQELFDVWLFDRRLEEGFLWRDPEGDIEVDGRQQLFYRYSGGDVMPGDDWEDAYHGTFFYGLWNILQHGIIKVCEDEPAGGVTLSTGYETAWGFAMPQAVFDLDGAYDRVVIKTKVDADAILEWRRHGGQLVVDPSGVVIEGIFVEPGTGVAEHEARLDEWDPVLEVVAAQIDGAWRMPPATTGARYQEACEVALRALAEAEERASPMQEQEDDEVWEVSSTSSSSSSYSSYSYSSGSASPFPLRERPRPGQDEAVVFGASPTS